MSDAMYRAIARKRDDHGLPMASFTWRAAWRAVGTVSGKSVGHKPRSERRAMWRGARRYYRAAARGERPE